MRGCHSSGSNLAFAGSRVNLNAARGGAQADSRGHAADPLTADDGCAEVTHTRVATSASAAAAIANVVIHPRTARPPLAV